MIIYYYCNIIVEIPLNDFRTLADRESWCEAQKIFEIKILTDQLMFGCAYDCTRMESQQNASRNETLRSSIVVIIEA